MSWIRTKEDLQQALENQCRALRASSTAYDSGELWEATRLATSVIVTVHDGGRNYQSILSQLGMRGRLRFVSTAFQYSSRNMLRETHLLSTKIYGDGMAEYKPLLDGAPHPIRFIQFHQWWEKELIFRDGEFNLTRKRLTHILRNKEGGAHLDPILQDANYLRFAKEQLTTPVVFSSGAPPKPILGAELASMRQIAWELLETLDRGKSSQIGTA
jgi:hypothetical protein